MTEKLDRTRDFAEVWGPGGVVGYHQDGLEFDPSGVAKGDQDAPERKRIGRPPKVTPEETRPQPVAGHAAMDDDTLRGLIEVRGDVWQGRSAAIKTLEEDA